MIKKFDVDKEIGNPFEFVSTPTLRRLALKLNEVIGVVNNEEQELPFIDIEEDDEYLKSEVISLQEYRDGKNGDKSD